MKINRLFEIVYLLLNKKTMTAKKLAIHFEVSVRTILRDIDILSTSGIPIYTTQGKGGGISILDKYVLNKATLSEDEQNQLLFALQSLSATQNINTLNFSSKLKSLFEKNDTNWIEVDFSRWGNNYSDNIKFDLLKNAVIGKNAINFQYFNSYGETKMYTIYPLKLIFNSKAWYIQGFCLTKKAYRTFKINRIQNTKILDETFLDTDFTIPKIDAPKYETSNIVNLKLLCSSSIAYRLYDEFSESAIIRNQDGTFIVSTEMPHDYWLYQYIFSFGDLVEVIEPDFMRKEIIKLAETIKNKYLPKT